MTSHWEIQDDLVFPFQLDLHFRMMAIWRKARGGRFFSLDDGVAEKRRSNRRGCWNPEYSKRFLLQEEAEKRKLLPSNSCFSLILVTIVILSPSNQLRITTDVINHQISANSIANVNSLTIVPCQYFDSESGRNFLPSVVLILKVDG